MMQLLCCIVQPMTSGPNRRAEALELLETEMAVLARRLEHASRKSDTYRRLDRAGYLVARTIDVNGPTSVIQLAQLLGLDGSTVTRQVGALASRHYVERHRDPHDGRAILVSLTEEGRREMEAVRVARMRRLDQSVAEWSPDDVQTLAELLERLNDSLVHGVAPR
jgi:DNA-binding MarR family transcriptional regulator